MSKAATSWTPARLGSLLGVSKRTINRRCEENLIPFVDQGTPKRPRRMISSETVKLIRVHGLAGVARMRAAGIL